MEQTIACRQWSQFLQSASPVEKDKTKTHEISFSTDFVPVWLKEINFCKLWSDVMCVRGLHDNWKPSKTSLLFWGLLFCFEGCYFHEMTAHQTRSQWIFLAKLSSLAAWNSETLTLVNLLTSKFSLLLIVCQGGRSCAGARVAPAKKFGLGRKF